MKVDAGFRATCVILDDNSTKCWGFNLHGALGAHQVMSIKLIISLVFLAVYIALYQPLGFILSSIFFLMAESFLLTNKGEVKKWALFIVLFSIGVSIVIYFIFTKYLTLVLPSGILG